MTLTCIWGDNPWLDDNGSYRCRITGIDVSPPAFTIKAGCHDGLGLSAADLNTALSGNGLPGVVLTGASHGCIVTSVTAISDETRLAVEDANCLSDADDALLRADAASGAGVILPRFSVRGQNRASLLKTVYFDHFGDTRSGAGLYFGVEESCRDDTASQSTIRSSANTDNFTSTWASINDFDAANALNLINPRGLSGFTVLVEALSDDTALATSNTGTGQASVLVRQNLNAAGLSSFLDSLHARRTSAGDAVMRFHLGSGDFVWIRDLRLVLD